MTRTYRLRLAFEVLPMEALKFVITVLSCFFPLITDADPGNFVQNGDFQTLSFVFDTYPVMDVISTGINNLVPFWTAAEGGVQMLDTRVYHTPVDYNATSVVHMNYKYGPGRLVSVPMYTLREGAVYTVSLRLADNPDGGPIAKAIGLAVNDILGKRVGPKLSPFVVSNSSTTRTDILWQRVAANVRGTGKAAYLTVESLTPGSYGPLVANIQVTLSSLVENGSFEILNSSISKANVTFFVIVNAPSTSINMWSVDSGALKIASAARYQASTDNTPIMLDLNANAQPSSISTTISIRSNTAHVLLFDTAINPEQNIALQGQLLVLVTGVPSAQSLVDESIDLDSTGYSIDSVGWNTYSIPFQTTKEDIRVKVAFVSKVSGSFGPLLDNIAVYEVTKALKDVNETVASVPPTVTTGLYFFTWKSEGHLDSQIPTSQLGFLMLVVMLFHSFYSLLGEPLVN